jgi:methionyl-tRNA formyltransferase
MTTLPSCRFLLAGYGFPAEYGLLQLFAAGVMPEQILALTDPLDDRNAGFVHALRLRGITHRFESAKTPTTIEAVQDFAPDIIISLHYRQRIPPAILQTARLGTVNLHPSLLPKYRGTNSVPWAIIHGEKETGFTFHTMEADFDTGHILLQQPIPIRPDDTAFSLFHRQITVAMPYLSDVLKKIIVKDRGIPQQGEGSYFPRAVPHGGHIDPTWSDAQIEHYIRAMIFPPFAPALLSINGVDHPVPTMAEYTRLRHNSKS